MDCSNRRGSSSWSGYSLLPEDKEKMSPKTGTPQINIVHRLVDAVATQQRMTYKPIFYLTNRTEKSRDTAIGTVCSRMS